MQWSRWYAVIAAIGLLFGAVWGIATRPGTHTESRVPVPGPTETREVQIPLLPDAEPEPERQPGWLLRPGQTKTVTVTEKPKGEGDGPDGRKEVVPSSAGSDTGGSLDGAAGEVSSSPVAPE